MFTFRALWSNYYFGLGLVLGVTVRFRIGLGLGYLAFSFLCTFVPGSEKSIERTFAPVELLFRGTFAPGERKVQELSFHGTFALLEISLLRSECSKNFRSTELQTFAPVERSLHKQLSCPLTFAPVELSLPYLKKLWKAGKQCFHRCMLANVRCCLLVGLCILRSLDSASPNLRVTHNLCCNL